MPDLLGSRPSGPAGELEWRGPDRSTHQSAAVIMASNNAYRLGRAGGSGTPPRLDGGVLGVAVLQGAHRAGSRWLQWSTPDFEVTSSQAVPVGVDGEALVLEAPLRFVSRPAALRVRIAPQHPGASPSAGLPGGISDVLGRLLAIVAGRA